MSDFFTYLDELALSTVLEIEAWATSLPPHKIIILVGVLPLFQLVKFGVELFYYLSLDSYKANMFFLCRNNIFVLCKR